MCVYIYFLGWSCFFGLVTSTQILLDDLSQMKSVYGVWSSGYNVSAGHRTGSHGQRRWNEKDHITLTFDCNNRKFIIENRRLFWREAFTINLDLCPFPWKFLTIIKQCKLRIENKS